MEYTDETILTWGKHSGKKLANIPANYLLWLFENKKANLDGKLKRYIEQNLDILNLEQKKEYLEYENSKNKPQTDSIY